MSQTDRVALIARLKDDEAFRDEIIAAPDEEARWRIIAAAGFDCTAEELATEDERLSKQQLVEISGGRTDTADNMLWLLSSTPRT